MSRFREDAGFAGGGRVAERRAARRLLPSEAEPFHAPVPTRMVSNGEYMPHPQTNQQKHVEHRVKELAEDAAKKLGISRRQFLAGTVVWPPRSWP